MNLNVIFILSLVFFISLTHSGIIDVDYDVKMLSEKFPKHSVDVQSHASRHFNIYCFAGEVYSVKNIWRSIYFRVWSKTNGATFRLILGGDEEAVLHVHSSSLASSWFDPFKWPWDLDCVQLAVFNRSCVGVSSDGSFVARLEIKRIDFWKVSRLVIGIVLFFLAPGLSRSSFFFYSSGIFLGLSASILILIFIFSRMIPKKSGAAALLIGGWALVLYFVQILWLNLSSVLQSYNKFVIGYFVVVGIISFAICYRYGPVSNERTINLMKWAIQGLALFLILSSSENKHFSTALVIIVLTVYSFPSRLSKALKTFWRRKFPPKIKLLTEDEYREQSNLHTQKSLKELREFCRSPNCDPWKTVGRLKSPIRFAKFVRGESDLLDEEILDYETTDGYTKIDSNFTDDDD